MESRFFNKLVLSKMFDEWMNECKPYITGHESYKSRNLWGENKIWVHLVNYQHPCHPLVPVLSVAFLALVHFMRTDWTSHRISPNSVSWVRGSKDGNRVHRRTALDWARPAICQALC